MFFYPTIFRASSSKITLVDLSKNKLEKNQWISNILKSEIDQCLENKEQALIFLNRRDIRP